jgi:hypothetical protein
MYEKRNLHLTWAYHRYIYLYIYIYIYIYMERERQRETFGYLSSRCKKVYKAETMGIEDCDFPGSRFDFEIYKNVAFFVYSFLESHYSHMYCLLFCVFSTYSH